jgi:Tfp pilus assembly protein PilN
MLRTNLSTRPFYNERAVRWVVLLCALVLAAITALNALQAVSLRSREGDLTARASAARAEATQLRTEAQRILAQVDPKELEIVSAAAREANDLIQQRTFSWVQLLSHLESAIPANVRLTQVDPSVDEGVITVSLFVEARTVEALAAFVDGLESKKVFRDVSLPEQNRADDGLYEATVQATYVPDQKPDMERTDGSSQASPARGDQ